jgi:ubiquinone/menaquinone biosynthesis C-methylase UbiE
MPVTFDTDELTPEYLEKFYRNAAGVPWQEELESFASDAGNRMRLELLVRELAATGAGTVLDAGCGGGALAALVAERQLTPRLSEYFTCDFSMAGSAAPSAGFAVANAQELPFGNSMFDAVVCSEVLEHLHNPADALGEILRVLRPGGFALLTVPNLFCLDSVDGRTGLVSGITKAAVRLGVMEQFKFGINTHITKQPPSYWKNLIESCGLRIEFDRGVFIFPYIPYFSKTLKNLEIRLFQKKNFFQTWFDAESAVADKMPLKIIGQFHYFRCKKQAACL